MFSIDSLNSVSICSYVPLSILDFLKILVFSLLHFVVLAKDLSTFLIF
jgi:hypothetical protein